MGSALKLHDATSIEALNAGLLISRQQGKHMDRVFGYFDLIFVREGVLSIQEENRAFEVSAGQSLLLWPGRRHQGIRDYPPDLRFYWLHFQQKPAQGDSAVSVTQHTTVIRPEFVECLFRRFMDEQESGRLVPAYANALAHLLLCEIAEQRQVSPSERTAAALAARAITYIRSHIQLALTASQVAEALDYNPTYLNRVFRQAYHHTLTQEIHLSRLGYARYLLLHSSKNVSEIARECGFQDIHGFYRLFKRYEGMSAMTFRRLYGQTLVNYD